MISLKTYHIHITGQVQGVGFRPFVYVLAVRQGIKGWVKNTIDGVHIRFNAPDQQNAGIFAAKVVDQAPELSIITGHSLQETSHESFDKFSIIHSDEAGKANLLVTPDFAMCKECEREVLDQNNRRVHYPFITCTNCGPRYSIITKLPYDRPYTTMESFAMCSACNKEYNDPLDRRYFSQTNSCPDCAIRMTVYRADKTRVPLPGVEEQIDFIVSQLREGAILAIKGIGGYLLICDASDEAVVSELRKRKYRPTKAFAMLFPDIESIDEQLVLHQAAKQWLESPVAPIVLMGKKQTAEPKYAYGAIAPGLDEIGVMIPYTPLYKLIMHRFGKAILATSGNISNEPIVFDDKQALEKLSKIADFIVINNREIVVPQDDSVIRFSPRFHQPILLRRSRGLAPGYLDERLDLPDNTILAAGAEMKSSFSFLFNGLTYISQYLGDLEDYGTQTAYQHTLGHFMALFNAKPESILHDLHPQYFTTRLAQQLAAKNGIRKYGILHHEAHFAAILGEKCLFDSKQILGLVWDGTGYGSDGQIWGGEVFLYKDNSIQRVAQLSYFDFILGDKMAREPRISALSLIAGLEQYTGEVRARFSQTEWSVYQKVLKTDSLLKTSSLGRLFDAVACLVLDIDVSSYEGEAAMYLEVAAKRFYATTNREYFIPFDLPVSNSPDLDSHTLIALLLESKKNGVAGDELAFRFHCTLVAWAERLIRYFGVSEIACSGGVFQNALLVDLLIVQLGDQYTLHFHEKMSPNDECISFGQLMHFTQGIKSKSF